DPKMPYFKGDGDDDHLTVENGEIKVVTNNGMEGTVIATMKATNKINFSFGVRDKNNINNRWASHVSWSNDQLYFDPGVCCNGPARSIDNKANLDKWDTYSFIRAANTSTIRSSLFQKTTSFTGQCIIANSLFAIGFATGAFSTEYATTGFNEFIMYKTDIVLSQVQEIEADAKTFWGIIKP
ncbi:hypothetical protein, partial [Flavobacterium sp.]|uniref:hypothetical protein n=1 Tax=Flavobacterium sp. TaxID=239 RepID=UPI0026376AA4